LTDSAAYRRLYEELGIKADLKYLYTFQYQATYSSAGSENELCAVYIGKSEAAPRVNRNEISDWQYIEPGKLSLELIDFAEKYTPWFKMEWEKISNEYMEVIKNL
jgi:isopentenyl-diphosphate delta-isomerase